ncbi:MAG: BlaI/MecI/CopY family transcriptional regulator [Planctomycetales bacterium]
MATRKQVLSDTELEVLKSLWEVGEGTVRELHERLAGQGRQWAYTTVLTFLMRLEVKGYVVSDKAGIAHRYRPVVSRDSLLRQKLVALADELCDGTAAPLMQALVSERHFSADEISQFRKLLDELEQQSPVSRKPKRKQ